MYKTKKITLRPKDDSIYRYEVCVSEDEITLSNFDSPKPSERDVVIFFASVEEMRQVAEAMLLMCKE